MNWQDAQNLNTDYGIILVECPLFHFSNPIVRELIAQCFSMRMKSYQKSYGVNVYPFGGEDMGSDHIFLVKKREKDFSLVCSLKYISMERCKYFNLTFPLLNTLGSDLNPKFLFEKIKQHIFNSPDKYKIAYCGGLSSDVDQLTNQDKHLIKDFVNFATCTYKKINSIDEILATGTTKNNFYKYVENFGFETIYPEPIIHKELSRHGVMIQSLKTVKEDAYNKVSFFNELWNNRITFDFNKDKNTNSSEAA